MISFQGAFRWGRFGDRQATENQWDLSEKMDLFIGLFLVCFASH